MRKAILAICLLLSLFSCKKEPLNQVSSMPPPFTIPVTVTVDQTNPGYTISSTFEGLSYETAILTQDPDVLNVKNHVLIQLIKNLGPGLLRIGGGTSDEIEWTGKTRTQATADNVLTTSDIDRLSAFAGAIGWQVLFGLDLGNNDSAAAANEAQYVYNKLGSNLYALQAGNEPDAYSLNGIRPSGYSYTYYQDQWLNYYNAVKSMVPQAFFAGPDVSNNTTFMTSFAENENKNVKLIDGHYYITGPASDPSITYQTLLAVNNGLSYYLQQYNHESISYNLPYRITETNNFYGGGKPGVSNVFASALWALDMMWTVAENNGQGINFHGGTGLSYSPLIINGSVITAMPEYYAMLAFKQGACVKVIPATINSSGYNCSAYASANADNTWSITLINKETTENISFTIQSGKTVSSIQIARLTAPSVISATGTMFAGSAVNSDGTFNPVITEQQVINTNSFVINVPAGSAAVVAVN